MVHLKKKQINRSERYGKDEELNKEGAKEHKVTVKRPEEKDVKEKPSYKLRT